jgi:succinoglycan biosynthesis protein ExoA
MVPAARANQEPQRDSSAVHLSVLVPVLNEERYIRAAAGTMQAQRFDGALEFLFVDGGSEDRTVEILEELARADERIRILVNPARATPNGLNVGLRHARGRFIARMDGHTHYPPDYLAQGVERLRRGDVDWVSGPQLAVGTDKWSRRVALALSSLLGTGGAGFRRLTEEETEVDSGFTGVWRRELLEALGGWDEGWPVDQDYELAARVRERGGRIVCLPGMAASYIPRNSLWRLLGQYWRYGYYKVKTLRAHPDSMRRSHVLPPGVAGATIAALAPWRPLRRAGRAGVAVYLTSILAASLRTATRGRRLDATSLPLVFATMHLSYGLGFLWGCVRLGVPVGGLLAIAGLRGDHLRRSGTRGPV